MLHLCRECSPIKEENSINIKMEDEWALQCDGVLPLEYSVVIIWKDNLLLLRLILQALFCEKSGDTAFMTICRMLLQLPDAWAAGLSFFTVLYYYQQLLWLHPQLLRHNTFATEGLSLITIFRRRPWIEWIIIDKAFLLTIFCWWDRE